MQKVRRIISSKLIMNKTLYTCLFLSKVMMKRPPIKKMIVIFPERDNLHIFKIRKTGPFVQVNAIIYPEGIHGSLRKGKKKINVTSG